MQIHCVAPPRLVCVGARCGLMTARLLDKLSGMRFSFKATKGVCYSASVTVMREM